MFGNKKGSTKIDSLIGQGTTLTGNIAFSGGLRIDGRVEGDVLAADRKNGTLVISEKAVITGAVQCSHLILNGEINGPIEVSKYVELQPKARVNGDLSYQTLEMHAGAVIQGRLVHLANGQRVEVDPASIEPVKEAN
ncbi:bactofilin family protein [Chitinilyticum litopenaei]|uniref:bactofilin family protein n=1 Tax=Chitinilyticum litopenaei TaxID=1121276 RepID=UPI0004007873|nr:polymer-forming cytoskeletal protein [Chitinilyticum litopenaei]